MHISKFCMFVIVILPVLALALPVPTTLNDFHLPGSQPNQSGTFNNPSQCDNCHGGYGEQAVEPAYNWRGSMMSQAMRDPLFLAAMTIANQDAPQSGDLCIRCHTPKGWLEGRSLPTDGSSLTAADREGVQCHFCHRAVKPTPLGVNPYPTDPAYTSGTYPADQTYLGTITQIPPVSGDGMYVVDATDVRRGPFTNAGTAPHQFYYSPFHARDAAMCGTCHDVSNPAFTRQPNGSYAPNAFDQPPPSANTYDLFPIERTFSEWLMSSYNSAQGVYAPQFGGNRDTVRTCQDCHMKDVTGHGCSHNSAPLRTNLPLHDMTGGNTVVPLWVAQQFPLEVNVSALNAGIARARYMLQNAASLEMTANADQGYPELNVRVTNETGHKLPSGYPEGRRIWLNIRAYNADSILVYESGAYDTTTAVLTHDEHLKVYHIEPGVSTALAPVVGLSPGPSFHFVVNDSIYYDNRIPPRGFTNANFATIQSPPVNYAYADGQYWDDTAYELPLNATYAVVTLYYQTTSKEFVEFLQAENTTNSTGTTAYNLWAANGKSRPEVMRRDTIEIPYMPPVPMIAVTAPNGGEEWTIGSLYSITFTRSNAPGEAVVELKRDYPAGSWEVITAGLTGSEYLWTATGPATSAARVRASLTGTPTVGDTCDANFSIVNTPALAMIFPNGGEEWLVGSEQVIQFARVNAPGSTAVLLNRNYPSGPWDTLSTTVAADTYAWIVAEPTTTTARVQVYLVSNPTVADTSDTEFSIIGPPPPVTDLTVTFEAAVNDSLDLSLNWTAVSGATQYRIFESLEPDAPGTQVATVSAPPHMIRVPAQPLKRFYYITALW